MQSEKISFEKFEDIIINAVDLLPKEFKDILDKNKIVLIAREDLPVALKPRYRGKIVFGIFIGVPFGRFFNSTSEPTRIELYKKSFEKVFDDPVEMEGQIVKTVMHEIGHYFGYDEKGIRELLG